MFLSKSFKSLHLFLRKRHCIFLNQNKCTHTEVSKSLTLKEKEKYRTAQARHTVYVHTNRFSLKWLPDALNQCGNVANITQYRRYQKKPFYLVEFQRLNIAKLCNHTYFHRACVDPRHFVFIVPHRGIQRKEDHPAVGESVIRPAEKQHFQLDDLVKAKSITEQIQLIHRGLMMTDSDVRLRYFVVSCLEENMKQSFKNASVHAFGSSVTGFGKSDGDLDMCINCSDAYPGGPLIGRLLTERSVLKRVLRILQKNQKFKIIEQVFDAKIPILQVVHFPSNLDCDISAQNQTSMRMSEILYWLAQSDPRVYPLVFTVRLWARMQSISSMGGQSPKLTNFQLTLLVLHFLQSCSVLPLLDDVCTTDITDLDTPLSMPSSIVTSTDSTALDELLHQFFIFYAVKDFSSLGISIKSGIIERQGLKSRPVYIENPVELKRNAGSTVEMDMLHKFRTGCKDASQKLESELGTRTSNKDWGVLTVLKDPIQAEFQNVFDLYSGSKKKIT